MQLSLRVHRLTLATTAPRVFAFIHTFGLTVWIALAEDQGWQLILPGIVLLIWPGLAYLHATVAKHAKQAEFKNLLFDTLLFGFWCSVLDFYILATITIGLACFMNNLVVGGTRRMLLSTLLFAMAALAGGLVTDAHFRPYVSVWLDIYQWMGAVVYFMTMGRVTYSQNRQIARSIRAIKFQNRAFHALLDLGTLANQITTIPSLLDEFLKHLHTHFPSYGFAVLLHERKRQSIIQFAAAAGLESGERQRLSALTAHMSVQQAPLVVAKQDDQGATLYITPMNNRLSLYEGWLIIRAPQENSGLEQILPLLADQLAGATENKLLQLELTKLAERDALTGLYNRGFFEAALQGSIDNKAHTPSIDFAVIVMDVDHLKTANDHYGHEAGDALITYVAKSLQACAREGDVLARYGGDEFTFLLPAAGLASAQQLVARIRHQLTEQCCVVHLPQGPQTLAVGLSLGFACSEEVPAQNVFALADERMYADKRQGRDQPTS